MITDYFEAPATLERMRTSWVGPYLDDLVARGADGRLERRRSHCDTVGRWRRAPFIASCCRAPKQRRLVLEPWGMEIDVAAGGEIVVETTAADPPAFDAESFTLWAGSGAELRILRSGQEIYSTLGNPVPSTPPGMSTRNFLQLLGIDKLPSD